MRSQSAAGRVGANDSANSWPVSLEVMIPASALSIWLACLGKIDPSEMSDLGLASALPYAAWLPPLLLSFGFFMLLHRPPTRAWVPYLYLASLVIVLHATPIIDYGTLRYPWAWKHLGIIDYILRSGAIDRTDPVFGAYQNWPGFFAAAALLSELSGARDLAAYARWSPLVFNLLYVGALPILYRSFTQDRRAILGATWFFVCGNWIGQDYFSPQALSFFFYLLMLAFCLRFLEPRPARNPEHVPHRFITMLQSGRHGVASNGSSANGAERMVAAGAVLIFLAAIILSHQLTPLVAISALAVLVLFRCIPAALLFLAIVLTGLWILYAAAPFVALALPIEMRGLSSTVLELNSQLIDLSVVSHGQATVALISRALTVAIILAALLGGVRRLVLGYREGIAAGLAAAPVPILAITSYGGEAIFRTYLFALPFLSLFAIWLFYPTARPRHPVPSALAAAMLALSLAIAFVFANNGKDRQYAFAPEDIAVMQRLYAALPERTLIVEGANFSPSLFRDIERVTRVSIADEPRQSRDDLVARPAATLAHWMDDDRYKAAFVVITRNQKAYVDDMGIMRTGDLDRIEQALLASPRFRLLYAAGGTSIFTLNRAVSGGGEWID